MSEVELVTSSKTKSRLLLKILLGIFLLCAVVVAGIGLFLYQAEQSRLAESAASSANMVERMKLQAELMKYRDSTKLTQRELESEEMVACLERVPIDRATQKTRLRDAVKARAKVDPHLKTALLDVFNAPLVGDQPPVQYSDLVDEFMADVDLMLTRFSKRNQRLEDVSGIRAALRQCLSDAYRFDPPPEDDLERVKAAEADGDPIVLFTLFKADPSISEEDQWKRVTTASDRIAESPDSFDPIFAAFVHTDALRFHAKDKKSDGYDAAVRRFLSSWPAAWQEASKREPNTGRDHTCLTLLSLSLEHLNAAAQVDLVKGLVNADEPSVPAYAVHLVVGDLFREVAFDHRGTKFVSETDASAMELFDKFATIASSHFVEAYLMRPELALLARRPLNIQMANGSTPLSVHHWFRLSLSGHIDHQSVYGTYSLALMPRWGGSEELQKRFAMKCLETKTEDGIVGMQSGRIMEDYLTRHTADVTMVDDPANVMWAKRSIDAWRTHLQCNRKFRCGILSAEFAMRILWEAGQFKEVAEFLEVLGDRSQDINWGKLNMDEAEVRFICQMADGPAYLLWMPIHLQLVFNSERLNDRNTSALHANLDELQTVWLDNSDFLASRFPGLSDEELASKRAYAKRVLDHRRTQLNLLERFHRGELIHFTTEELAASFTPIGKPQSVELRSSAQCQREAAQLALDIEGVVRNQSVQADTVDTPIDERNESLDDIANVPGGFRVATDWLDYTFVLRNQIRYPLPARYEITATFIEAPNSPHGVSLLCGPDGRSGLFNELRGTQIRFSPGGKFLLTDELPEKWGQTPIFRQWILKEAKQRTRHLRLDIGRRGYRILVDGEQLHERETPLRTEGLFQVGCASSRRFDQTPGIPMVFNVYDFRVQRLEEAPFEEPSYDDLDGLDGLDGEAETNGFL
ncbi:hypothetical protein [Rhodopirellula halodulae]|uniref:hypothetical protein n=1 Tax=Rhodopirellula halodulae TaxID=2894198 RepID=UPI0036F2D8DC